MKKLTKNKTHVIFWHYPYSKIQQVASDYTKKNNVVLLNIVTHLPPLEIVKIDGLNFGLMAYINDKTKYPNIKINASIAIKFAEYESSVFRVIERDLGRYGVIPTFKKIKDYYLYYLTIISEIYESFDLKKIIYFDIPHHPFDYMLSLLSDAYNIHSIVINRFIFGQKTPLKYFVASDRFPLMSKDLLIRIEELADFSQLELVHKLSPLELSVIENITEISEYKTLKLSSVHTGGNSLNRLYILAKYRVKKGFEYLRKFDFSITLIKISRYVKFVLLNPFYRKLYKCYYHRHCISVNDLNTLEDFVYFPLHSQPEATTVPLGGIFENQKLVIENILENTPNHVVLIIKEHPAMWSRTSALENINTTRSLGYYKDLVKNERIVFVGEDVNPYFLIKKSLFTVSVTGTVILESLFFNKFCIVFGNYPYSCLPNAIHKPFSSVDYLSLTKSKHLQEKPYFLAAILAFNEFSIDYYDEDLKIFSKGYI